MKKARNLTATTLLLLSFALGNGARTMSIEVPAPSTTVERTI